MVHFKRLTALSDDVPCINVIILRMRSVIQIKT